MMGTLFQLISHEYRRYIFTRGFLLLITLIPLSAMFGIFAESVNEQTKPVRAFVVIDDTARFISAIDDALQQERLREELQTWDIYADIAVVRDEQGELPLPDPFRPAEITEQRLKAFEEAGGLTAAQMIAAPVIREGMPPLPDIRPRFVRVPLPENVQNASNREEQVERLRAHLQGDGTLADNRTLFAAVIIPRRVLDGGDVQYWTNNLIDRELAGFIDNTLTQKLQRDRFIDEGLSDEALADIRQIDVPVSTFKATAGDDASAADRATFQTLIPLMLAYALFFMILSVGGMLLTSTVEEKSNKIVEVLLSSVSATQLMVGKLVGLALVGITLPTIFLLLGLVVSQLLGAAGGGASDQAEMMNAIQSSLFDSHLIPLFFFYFLLGYLLFASIYLAVGALSSSIQDAQSFVGPLTILLILPFPFLFQIIQDPNGILARIFTWIPLYTPYAVMIRMTSNPPFWEIVGATCLLAATVILVVTRMGRIYRNGVLSSGGAPSLKKVRELSKSR